MFSDNKSYIFGVTAWTDGQQSWGLWTTGPLTPEIREKALGHAKQLGFNQNFAIESSNANFVKLLIDTIFRFQFVSYFSPISCFQNNKIK